MVFGRVQEYLHRNSQENIIQAALLVHWLTSWRPLPCSPSSRMDGLGPSLPLTRACSDC